MIVNAPSLKGQTNTFATLKRYKIKEVIKILEAEGWTLAYWTGDHRQFKHTEKAGKVTIRGKLSETLTQELLSSIWHQAGWK